MLKKKIYKSLQSFCLLLLSFVILFHWIFGAYISLFKTFQLLSGILVYFHFCELKSAHKTKAHHWKVNLHADVFWIRNRWFALEVWSHESTTTENQINSKEISHHDQHEQQIISFHCRSLIYFLLTELSHEMYLLRLICDDDSCAYYLRSRTFEFKFT